MENPIAAAALAGSVAVQDLTVWGLFLEADWIVKAVIVLLVVASFWTWTIIFDKVIRIRRLRAPARPFEEAFWSGGSLEELSARIGPRPPDPMSSIFVAAMREWRRSAAKGLLDTDQLRAGLQGRVARGVGTTVGRGV